MGQVPWLGRLWAEVYQQFSIGAAGQANGRSDRTDNKQLYFRNVEQRE
jgi:hypothetical protein